MSEIKVNSIKGVGASAAAITVNNSDGTCTANLTNKPNRNLIINGAMQVAQRGSSTISSTAYGDVDRFQLEVYGLDQGITLAQADVASGTTPYTLGFRKSLKLTNGNQTSVGGTDTVRLLHKIEAQDVAQSGWNHKSASSFITLSFWIKSSIAQSFKVSLISWDGSARTYVFDTGSLSADTWTKVTKTIPGDSNVTIDNDNANGFQISFYQYLGTTYTSSGYTENQWNAYANPQTPDQTNTWYDTDNATFELTGVQLEVGSVATDFEHRSFGQELALCQRYYYQIAPAVSESLIGTTVNPDAGADLCTIRFPVEMRNEPTLVVSNFSNAFRLYASAGTRNPSTFTLNTGVGSNKSVQISVSGGTSGAVGFLRVYNPDSGVYATVAVTAEL